ncbi:unnamed protein product [Cuscuta campestris]|uniref:MULE transposase domain-containing protein n=1 Tax=Cuscuta campestris TaxID=132261 RepID=A0A484KN89_9ASTE|nr:unnamed protein product [Cuscuta campestris]
MCIERSIDAVWRGHEVFGLPPQHNKWTEPDNNGKDNVHDGRGHKKLKRSKKRSVVDGGIQQFEITQLSAKLLAKELKGLEAYDIPTLSEPYIPPLDTFFEEIVDLNQYGCDEVVSNGSKGCIEDDDEESDYEDIKEHHKRAEAAWVASHMLKEFRSNREMNADTVQKRMLTKFNTYIRNYTCWRTLKLMRNMVEGRDEDGYKLLPQYLEQITRMRQSGVFFLNGLADALGCLEDASKYTIISDRHQAIVTGLHNVLPKASRRICVLHFYKNFASKFSGAWFHSFFYIVANTFSEYAFNRAMDKIKEEDAEAYEWLMKNEPHEHWARHKFNPSLKCEDNTNNFVESFNKAIVAHRAKQILQMLEEIRKLVGNRI